MKKEKSSLSKKDKEKIIENFFKETGEVSIDKKDFSKIIKAFGKDFRFPFGKLKDEERRLSSLKKIKVINDAFREEGRITIRRIYYILVSKGLISTKKSSYNGMDRHLTQWREKGLIDEDMILDLARHPRLPFTFTNLKEAIKWTTECYEKDVTQKQDNYIEVWVEKDTMLGAFTDICKEYQVALWPSKGFTSHTVKKDLRNRLQNIRKPIIILYLGDYDAEGLYIPKKIEEYLSDKEINFKRIAVLDNDIKDLFPTEWLTNEKHLEKEYVQDYIKRIEKMGFQNVKWEVEAMNFGEQRQRLTEELKEIVNLDFIKKAQKSAKKEVKRFYKKYYKK